MQQTSFPPNGIIFAGAGILGATGAGSGVNLTAAQVRAFASVYSTTEVDTAIAGKADKATTLAGYGITGALVSGASNDQLTHKFSNLWVAAGNSNDVTLTSLGVTGTFIKWGSHVIVTQDNLFFGGITAAHAKWMRSGTTLAAKLGDGSADAPITASSVGGSTQVYVGTALNRLAILADTGGVAYLYVNGGIKFGPPGGDIGGLADITITRPTSNQLAFSSGAAFSGDAKLTGTYPSYVIQPAGWAGSSFYFQAGVNVAATGTGNYTAFVNVLNKGFAWVQGNPGTTGRYNLVIDATTGNVLIGTATDDGVNKLQVAGSAKLSGALYLGPYTFATLPSASANSGASLRITDRGQKQAYSDGTNWLFVHDNSVVV